MNTSRPNATRHPFILLLACSACLVGGVALAQEPGADREERRPPRREGTADNRSESLTDAQKTKVKEILAGYKADALTADQAKAIHDAFRQAGIPGGPAENTAVKEAGFDSGRLRELDAPPAEGGGGREPAEAGAGGPQECPQEAGASADQRKDDARGDEGGRDGKGRKGGKGGGKGGGQMPYSIEQAVSDNAQLHTIAFSGLAFLTGDFGADTFLPPGKVCDFFGFQYMRDIDAAKKGHNPMFLDRVAGNVLKTLSAGQRAQFEKAAREEAVALRSLAEKRLPLIKAFCRQLSGDIPAGSKGLDKASVMQYTGDFFAFDAAVCLKRAKLFGQVANSFTPEQKAYLAKMKFGDFNSWPAVDMDQYKLPRGSEKMVNVTYMTYASEFFSWYAGSAEADTYFCPERHGTYFGGFYMKDMPAMGKRDYDISTSVTGDSGKEFLNILTPEQRKNVTAIPDMQRKALAEIVEVRRAISTELRKCLAGGQADEKKVLALGRRYGELDGELAYFYATAFATANRTLTAEQRKALVKLRNLDGYTSAPAYLYSDAQKEAAKLPDTDHFFFPPKAAQETSAK
jgi:Spy/CpxP family protein refolding chaperone